MKHIGELVEGAQNILQQLWEKNVHLQQINQTLPTILPQPLARHCRVVNLREKTVVIYTDSAAWATRLRYLIPTILQAWQQQPFDINKIEIKVHLEAIEPLIASDASLTVVAPPVTHSAAQQPPKTTRPETAATKKNRGPYPLTENAADYLRNTANATAHPRLKAVLLRLASRSQTDNGCK